MLLFMEFEAKDGYFYFRVKHLKIILHWGKCKC